MTKELDRTGPGFAIKVKRTKSKSPKGKRGTVIGNKTVANPEHAFRYSRTLKPEDEGTLRSKVRKLFEPEKGIFAVDATEEDLGEQLNGIGLENTLENRRNYLLALLGDTKTLRHYVSGVLLRSETACLPLGKGRKGSVLSMLADKGFCVGVRVDHMPMPVNAGVKDEATTQGTDDLVQFPKQFKEKGFSFTFFRVVFTFGDYTPSILVIHEHARTMARFAMFSQAAGLVPVLSLELMNKCPATNAERELSEYGTITKTIMSCVTKALADYNVYLEGVIIHLNPVFLCHKEMDTSEIRKIAHTTMHCTVGHMPPAIGGLTLADSTNLSDASKLLNEVNLTRIVKPFPITFDWGRVITEGLMKEWNGLDKNTSRVQQTVLSRIKSCSLASMGQLPKCHRTLFITNVSEV